MSAAPKFTPDLLRRLRAAEADYTIAWGDGDLYEEAADALATYADALRGIADLQTWDECYSATPQRRLTKADCSNAADYAILAARAALAKVAP